MKYQARLAFLAPLILSLAACAPEPTPPITSPAAPPPVASPSAQSPSNDEPVPTVRLPNDVRPTAESLALTIDPSQDRFSGVVEIAVTLDHPHTTVWLHGKGLHVTRATVTPEGGTPLEATWAQRDETGIASVTAPRALSGNVKVRVEYDAPFNLSLEGLHKTSQAGVPYAFTQFESIAARTAFPCFDEPGFKIPWDETLVVPKGAQAIANTREVGRADEGASTRVRFATTLPLPSYLTAFAVGPLDIVAAPDVPPNGVRKRPLPLRGVTAKGRGGEIRYALAHTGEFVALLEKYFGIEYPYDKLDIIAVPDKGGAMENAGAITFKEFLVLMDEKTAPLQQKRIYARVMAHELAHQWVGDLVTAAWWDDIWLNESFAEWLASKIVDQWDPKTEGAMGLLDGVQSAMGEDSHVSARSIRQPIASTHDIENAFDSITYEKGGGVLAMFERWIGADTFQRGVHDYLASRAFKSGTADDFLGAMSAAAGKDVKTAFHTFLDQPGVPFIEARVSCDGAPRLHLTQSRYLPAGTTGDPNRLWQIPICARSHEAGAKDTKEACTLLTEKEGDLLLGDTKCPEWVFPNADAAGYFRFALAPADLANVKKGLARLTEKDRVAYANSLRASFNRGTLLMKDIVEAAAPLALDSHPDVAGEPQGYVHQAHDWLFGDPLQKEVDAYGQRLYRPAYQRLGWTPQKTDDDDRRVMRADVLRFMALDVDDPAARAEGKKRGLAYLGYGKDGAIHPEAVDKDLAGIAVAVAGQDADAALWDAMHAQLVKSDDDVVRGRLLAGLSRARSPAQAARARDLSLDPALRVTEVIGPIRTQMAMNETRDAAWQWVKDHFDALMARVSQHHGRSRVIGLVGDFCDEAHAKEAEDFFTPRAASIEGGPRVLASTLEGIRLCIAKRKIQEPSAREMFAKTAKTATTAKTPKTANTK